MIIVDIVALALFALGVTLDVRTSRQKARRLVLFRDKFRWTERLGIPVLALGIYHSIASLIF